MHFPLNSSIKALKLGAVGIIFLGDIKVSHHNVIAA